MPPGVGRLMALTGCHLLGNVDAIDSKLASHYVKSTTLPDLLSALKGADLSAASDAEVTACIQRFAESTAEGTGKITANAAIATSIAAAENLSAARKVLEDAQLTRSQLPGIGDNLYIKATKVIGPVTQTNDHAYKVLGAWYHRDEVEDPAAAWASELLKAMSAGAPLSQAVAWRLASQAEAEARKDLSESERLAVALERDFATMSRVIYAPDFLEGTRAVLVDKDNSPSWKPSSSSEVTESQVAEATAVLPESERHLGLTSLSWP